jgi:hypothetical protein
MSAKAAIEGVFSPDVALSLWTANTLQVYPATLQQFSVGSVLPAVLYMFRRGYRRGRGRFQEEFGLEDMRASVWSVSGKLTDNSDHFVGFENDVAKDILGDLLLCDALENKRHAEGHKEEVLRAFPVHFFSSWLDLPPKVAHLRFVPEMLVAMLANQESGKVLVPSNEAPFAVAGNPQHNILLRIFGRGVRFGENAAVLAGAMSDTVSADAEFSVEEWLMVRLGQVCGQAPEKLRQTRGGIPEIPNLRPLASDAAEAFRKDLSGFLSAYGETIPRRALTPMLEALIGLGLWHSFLASLRAIVAWSQTGDVPTAGNQRPLALLVDASSGTDAALRELAEQSTLDMVRFLDEATVALAVVRVLDAVCKDSAELVSDLPTGPHRDGWLNILGQVRMGRHAESPFARRALSTKCNQLAARLEDDDVAGEAVAILRGVTIRSDPARALAEAICTMMGEKLLKVSYLKFLDSAAMANEPHGLVHKRTVQRTLSNGKKKRTEARSVVLSNILLETLVHIHLLPRGVRLSFRDFLSILRDRYGLWVDEAPPGLTAARADLLRNRAILEHRLRDLGLLIGVNDAESMKRLQPRYRMADEPQNPVA